MSCSPTVFVATMMLGILMRVSSIWSLLVSGLLVTSISKAAIPSYPIFSRSTTTVLPLMSPFSMSVL